MKRAAVGFLAGLAWAASAPAQTAEQRWNDPSGVPSLIGSGGSAVATDADTIYVSCGTHYVSAFTVLDPSSPRGFYKYSISAATWTAMAPLPVDMNGGSIVHRSGSTEIYLITHSVGTSGFFLYDMILKSWRELPGLTVASGASLATPYCVAAATRDKVYAIGGYGTDARFGVFNPSSRSWSYPAALPWALYGQPSMVCPDPDGAFLSAFPGDTAVMRYSIASNEWISSRSEPHTVESLPFSGEGCGFGASSQGSLACLSRETRHLLFYDATMRRWSEVAKTPGSCGSGAAIAFVPGGDLVFCLRGGGTADVWRYSISGRRFLSALPSPVGDVRTEWGLAAMNDGETLYALGYDEGLCLYRYRISTGGWWPLGGLPWGSDEASSLVWDGASSLYCLVGGEVLLRYFLPEGPWTNATMPPVTYNSSRLLSADGDVFIADGPALYRFEPGSLEWSIMPGGVMFGRDGVLACPVGGDRIYALTGPTNTLTLAVQTSGREFHAYSKTAGTWTRLADCPAPVGPGCALCATGPNRILAFRGGSFPTLWSYSIRDNAWTAEQDAPGSLQTGANLVYPGAGNFLYAVQGSASDRFWSYYFPGAPDVPTLLAQVQRDGATPLDLGGFTKGPRLIVGARVEDPDDLHVTCEIQVREAGLAFTKGAPLVSSALLPSGSNVSIIIDEGLEIGRSYHWCARSVNSNGVASAWKSFGESPSSVDFSVRDNPPPALASVGQFTPDGRALDVGRIVAPVPGDSSILFRAALVDPEGDASAWEIEIRAAAEAFTGLPTARVAADPTGFATVSVILGKGAYHWRHRAVDAFGAATTWMDFGGNGEFDPDFSLHSLGSQGNSHCASASAGRDSSWRVGALAAVVVVLGLGSKKGTRMDFTKCASILIAAAWVSAAVTGGCGGEDKGAGLSPVGSSPPGDEFVVPPVPAPILSISPAAPEIELGGSVELTCLRTNGATFESNVSAVWVSFDASIASVTREGEIATITARRPGTVIIQAYVDGFNGLNGLMAQTSVSVGRGEPVAIAISPDSVSMYLGQAGSKDLVCWAIYASGYWEVVEATWSSDNPAVASVAPIAGMVTTVSAVSVGNTTVEAWVGPLGVSIPVAVHGVRSAAISPIPDVCPGATFPLHCEATYDDDVRMVLPVDWSSRNAAVATVAPAHGVSATVTGVTPGTAVLEARSAAIAAPATATVSVIALPGVFYGVDGDNGTLGMTLSAYPADGSDPVKLFAWDELPYFDDGPINGLYWEGSYGFTGLVLDAGGTALYAMTTVEYTPPEKIIHTRIFKVDLATRVPSLVATLRPHDEDGFFFPMGLDFDNQGMLVTHDPWSGRIYRIDPSTGAVAILGRTFGEFDAPQGPGIGMAFHTVIGPNDQLYFGVIDSAGSWVYRHDTTTGATDSWAPVPPGQIYQTGTAIDGSGRIYTSSCEDPAAARLWIARDLSGNGTALDPDEQTDYATIPFTLSPNDTTRMASLSTAYGGLLVDCLRNGLWWVRDLDGDGVANGPGEMVLVRRSIYNYFGFECHRLAAPK